MQYLSYLQLACKDCSCQHCTSELVIAVSETGAVRQQQPHYLHSSSVFQESQHLRTTMSCCSVSSAAPATSSCCTMSP
eukprot:14337-Heterococcus_DN1.PRE.3